MENKKTQAWMPTTAGRKLEWLDVLFEDGSLSQTAKNVAWRLVRHHNDASGRCDPKQATLAKGIGRSARIVSDAIRELKESGWIEVNKHRDGAHYVLVLDRAEAVEAGESRDQSRFRQERYRASATRSVAYPLRDQSRTEPLIGTTKKTTHPTTAPAAVASAPETDSPAKVQSVMPDQPVTKLPVAANDDDAPRLGIVRISGLEIPGEMYAEWEVSFRDLDLRPAIISRAKWAVGLGEKRPGHRLRALQTELGKMNEKARQDRLTRQENRQADVTAGIKRDEYGRVIGAKNTSRFQL